MRVPRFRLRTLLIVVALSALLTGGFALAVDAVREAREMARRQQCSLSLRQIGVAPYNDHGLDPARRPDLGQGRRFGGMPRGAAMALSADGSVRPIRESIGPNVFEAPSTMAGG